MPKRHRFPPPRPRWLNHLWATILGFFWLPCPKCHQMFGGHEIGNTYVTVGGISEHLPGLDEGDVDVTAFMKPRHLACCWRHG